MFRLPAVSGRAFARTVVCSFAWCQPVRFAVLSMSIALLVSAVKSTASTRFVAPFRAYETGREPQSVAVADWNGDGRRDVAVAARLDSTVSIRLAEPDGSLGSGAEVFVGRGATAVASGDLDGDGSQDLVLLRGRPEAAFYTVLMGRGDGSFGPVLDMPLNGDTPSSLALSDLDLDTHLDVVATTRSGSGFSRIIVLLGHGDGTFAAPTTAALVTSGAVLVVADLDGNGFPDVVTASSGSSIRVAIGKGDGTFQPPVAYTSTTSSPACLAAGDLNGDGHVDVAFGTVGGIAIHLGNGDGTLGTRHSYPSASTPTSLAVGDLNRDGRMDVVTANGRRGTLSLFLGDGSGGLGVPSEFLTGGGPWAGGSPFDPMFVTVADLDGHGVPDIVVVNPVSNTISVHLGNGNGTFGQQTYLGTGASPYAVTAGDFNGDGKADLVSTNGDRTLSVHLGIGGGSFAPHTEVAPPRTPAGYPIAGDVDLDGRTDLIVPNADSTLSVWLGSEQGLSQTSLDCLLPTRGFHLAIGDLDADGFPDMVLSRGGFATEPDTGAALLVLLGVGDGTFSVQASIPASGFAGAVSMGDIDGDSDQDVVIANDFDQSYSIFLGNGNGTFQPRQDFAGAPNGGAHPTLLALGDLNEDGRADLVLASTVSSDAKVYVSLGNIAGTFTPAETLATSAQGGTLVIGDLDSDGHLDLVQTGTASNTAVVFPGLGDGSFGPREDYGTDLLPFSVALTDVDADGHADLVLPVTDSNQMLLLRDFRSVLGVVPAAPIRHIALGSSYPNPSRGDLVIPFTVSRPGLTSLRVYDLAGRLIRELVQGPLEAGPHSVIWDARSDRGQLVSEGVYFSELRQAGEHRIGRVVVIR